MLRQLIRAYRDLYFAVDRFYRRRHRRPLTPVQEADRLIREMREREKLARRLTLRR
jgi:hypothetical protein